MGFPNVEHRSDVVAWDFLMFNIDLSVVAWDFLMLNIIMSMLLHGIS